MEILEEILMDHARRYAGRLPVHPVAWRIINAFTETVQARAAGKEGLRWREYAESGYWQEWYCEPPRPRHRARITRDDRAMENNLPVRRIYEVEEIHGAAGSTEDGDSGRAAPAPETATPAQGG